MKTSILFCLILAIAAADLTAVEEVEDMEEGKYLVQSGTSMEI